MQQLTWSTCQACPTTVSQKPKEPKRPQTFAFHAAILVGSTFRTRTRAGLLGPWARGEHLRSTLSSTTAYLQVVQVAAHAPLHIQLLTQLLHLAVQTRHTSSGLRVGCIIAYELR